MADEERFSPLDPPPDPRKGIFVFASGRKGSGKSVVCRWWFDQYPFDRIVIDPTHDVRADLRRDLVDFEELHADMLPARLPRPDAARPRTWLFAPDMGSATAADDMDRVAGLALGRGPTLLWSDEFGTQTTAQRTGPNGRRILHHGRHDALTFLAACPRPKDINGLAINQADLVYTFRTPNAYDREAIARNIGMDTREFDTINADLARRGDHWHTLYEQAYDTLWICPPLPVRRQRLYPAVPATTAGDLE